MYQQGGQQFMDELHHQQLRTGQLKDITSRLEKIESRRHSFDTLTDQLSVSNLYQTAPNNSVSSKQQAQLNHHLQEPKPSLSMGSSRRSSPSRRTSPKHKPSLSMDSAGGLYVKNDYLLLFLDTD
jgi:hypothetical protein